MKIVSWNVNGLRAAIRKGFLDWFKKSDADIICLQELRAETHELPPEIVNPEGYFTWFNPSGIKKGHSGTVILSKTNPISVELSIGIDRFDAEGRVIKAIFPKFTLLNLYIPQGGRQKENMGYKLSSVDRLIDSLPNGRKENVIISGDWNIAHKEIDLARPRENRDNTCFTEPERARIDALIKKGFVDSFRSQNPDSVGHYTWWSQIGNCRAKNIGWRVDYIFASERLAKNISSAYLLPEVTGSDHCPTVAEFANFDEFSSKR